MRTRDNTCCFTGHRDISNVLYKDIIDRLEILVMRLIKNGYKYFACGGALGFDTVAATYIISLKNRGFDVKLVLMLPCTDQTAKWSRDDVAIYNHIMDLADEVIYVSNSTYYAGCMQKRNRALVDASKACICFLSEYGSSGTRQTVDYAIKCGLKIANVADE